MSTLSHESAPGKKIETIAELKKVKFRWCLDCGKINCQNADHSSNDAVWLIDIEKFEASVRRRLKELETKYPTEPKIYTSGVWCDSGEMATLRRLLGEG